MESSRTRMQRDETEGRTTSSDSQSARQVIYHPLTPAHSDLEEIKEAIESGIAKFRHIVWDERRHSFTPSGTLLIGTGIGAALGILSSSRHPNKISRLSNLVTGATVGLLTAAVLTSEERKEIANNISDLVSSAIGGILPKRTIKSGQESIARADLEFSDEQGTPPEGQREESSESRYTVESVALRPIISIMEQDEEAREFVEQVCSEAKVVHWNFEAAPNVEAFIERNALDSPDLVVELDYNSNSSRKPDVSNITILGIYPSKAIRSLPAEVSFVGDRITATIDDIFFLVDPDGSQPALDIPSFRSEVRVFAISKE